MLILGEKYKFTTLEIEHLKKNFQKINYISYKNRDANEVIGDIKEILNRDKSTIIILNTKVKIDNKIIEFLIDLKFSQEFKDVKFISIEHFLEKYLYKCYIPDEMENINFLEDIQPFNLYTKFIKTIIDYTLSISLLILSSPIMLYSAYKIKKESSGPILFKQKRVGLNGKEFTCYKFRSMYIDAEKDGAKFAKKNDNRVFPWGKFMRETRIDELPQLLNIIKGEMSLIGPRPERKIWIKKFEKQIPYYNERHLVKPGITGWAQVFYPYGSNSFDAKQKLMYDLYYIRYWTPLLDIKILFRTIEVIICRRGV